MVTGADSLKRTSVTTQSVDGYGEYIPTHDPANEVQLPQLNLIEGAVVPFGPIVLPDLEPIEGEVLTDEIILPELDALQESPLLSDDYQDMKSWFAEIKRRYVLESDYKEFLSAIDRKLKDTKIVDTEKAEYSAMGVGVVLLSKKRNNLDYYLKEFEKNFLTTKSDVNKQSVEYGFWVLDAVSKYTSNSKYREHVKSIYSRCFQTCPMETYSWLTDGIYAEHLSEHFNNITKPSDTKKRVKRQEEVLIARDRFRQINSRFLSLGLIDKEMKPEDARKIHAYCLELAKRQQLAGKNGIKIDPFKLDNVLVGKVFGRGYTGLSSSMMPASNESLINRPIISLPDYRITYRNFGEEGIKSKFDIMDIAGDKARENGFQLDNARDIARDLGDDDLFNLLDTNDPVGFKDTGIDEAFKLNDVPRGFGTVVIDPAIADINKQLVSEEEFIAPDGSAVYKKVETEAAVQDLTLQHNQFYSEQAHTEKDSAIDTTISLHSGYAKTTTIVDDGTISEQRTQTFNDFHTRERNTDLQLTTTTVQESYPTGAESVTVTTDLTGTQKRTDVYNAARTRTIDRDITQSKAEVKTTIDMFGNTALNEETKEIINEKIVDVRNPNRTITTDNKWETSKEVETKYNPDGTLAVEGTRTYQLESDRSDVRTGRTINSEIDGTIVRESKGTIGLDGNEAEDYIETQDFDVTKNDKRVDREIDTVSEQNVGIDGKLVKRLDGSETEDREITSTVVENSVSSRKDGRVDVKDSTTLVEQTDHRELRADGVSQTTVGQGTIAVDSHEVSTRNAGSRVETTDALYDGIYDFSIVVNSDSSEIQTSSSEGVATRIISDIRPNRTTTGKEVESITQNAVVNTATDGSVTTSGGSTSETIADYFSIYNPFRNITTHSEIEYSQNYLSFENIYGKTVTTGDFTRNSEIGMFERWGNTTTDSTITEDIAGTFSRNDFANGTYVENLDYTGLRNIHSLMLSPDYSLRTESVLDYHTSLQNQLLLNGTFLSHEDTVGHEDRTQELRGDGYSADSTTNTDFHRTVDSTVKVNGEEQVNTNIEAKYHTEITEMMDALIRESVIDGAIDYSSKLNIDANGNSTERIHSEEKLEAHIVESLSDIYNRIITYEETVTTDELRQSDIYGNETRDMHREEARHQVALETIRDLYVARTEYWRERTIDRHTSITADASATVSQDVTEEKYQESSKRLNGIFEEFSKEVEKLKYTETYTENADGTQSARKVSFDPNVDKVDATFLRVDENGRIRLQKAEYKGGVKTSQLETSNYFIPQAFAHDEIKIGLTDNLSLYNTFDSVRTGEFSSSGFSVDGDKVTTPAGETEVPELVNSSYKWLLDWNKGNPSGEGKWNMSLFGEQSRTKNNVGADVSYTNEYSEGSNLKLGLNLNNLYNNDSAQEYRFGYWDYGDNGYRFQNRTRANLMSRDLGVIPYIGGETKLDDESTPGIREKLSYRLGYDLAYTQEATPVVAELNYEKRNEVTGLGYDLGLKYSAQESMDEDFNMDPYNMLALNYRVKKDIGEDFLAYAEGRNYFSDSEDARDSRYRLGIDYNPNDMFNLGLFGEYRNENIDNGQYQDLFDLGLQLGANRSFYSKPKYDGDSYMSEFNEDALDGIASGIGDNTTPRFIGSDRFISQFRGELETNAEKVTDASKREIVQLRGFGLVKLNQGDPLVGAGATLTFPYEFRRSSNASLSEDGNTYSVNGGTSVYGKAGIGIDQTLTPYATATMNVNQGITAKASVNADANVQVLGVVPYCGGQVNASIPVSDSVNLNVGTQNGVTIKSNSGDTYGVTGGLNADRVGFRFKKGNVHFGTTETTLDVCMPGSGASFFPIMVNSEKKPGEVAFLDNGKVVSYDGDRELMLTGGSRQKFSQINKMFVEMNKQGIEVNSDDETLNSMCGSDKDIKRMEFFLATLANYKQKKEPGFSFLKSVKFLSGKFLLNPVNWFSTESMFIEEGNLYISEDAFDNIDFSKELSSQIVFRATPVNVSLSRWVEKISINNKLTEQRAERFEKMGNFFVDSEVIIEGEGDELLTDQAIDGIIAYLEFLSQNFSVTKVNNRVFTIKLTDDDTEAEVETGHDSKNVIIDFSMVKSFALHDAWLRKATAVTKGLNETAAFKEKTYGQKVKELVDDLEKMGIDVRSDDWSKVRMDYLYESLKSARDLLSERLNKTDSGLGSIFGSSKFYGIKTIYIGDKDVYHGVGLVNLNTTMIERKHKNMKSYVADRLKVASFGDSSQLLRLHNILQKENNVNANRLDFIKTTYNFIPGKAIIYQNGAKDIKYLAVNIGKKELGDNYEITMRLTKDKNGKFNEPQIAIRKIVKDGWGKYSLESNTAPEFIAFRKFDFEKYGVGFLEAFVDSVGTDDRFKDSAVPGIISISTRRSRK